MQAHSQLGGDGTLEPSPSPTSHSGQWQQWDKRPPPGVLGPSIPFWAAVTSSCFRFCTVSQSGEERRGGEKMGFQVPPPPHTPPVSWGWRPWAYHVGGVERWDTGVLDRVGSSQRWAEGVWEGGQGGRHNGKIGLQRLCWAPWGLTVGFWEGTQEGDRLGLGVSSRQKRNRVSSPAHSRMVASPNSASCTLCPQHLRLLENFGNSAGSGENARGGRLRLGLAMPVSPSPRASKPRSLSRAHTKAVDLRGPPASSVRLLSCLSCPPASAPRPDFVPLCIHASLSLQLSSPISATPSAHAPVVSKPASGPGHCPERQAQDQELRSFLHGPLIRWLTPTQLSL